MKITIQKLKQIIKEEIEKEIEKEIDASKKVELRDDDIDLYMAVATNPWLLKFIQQKIAASQTKYTSYNTPVDSKTFGVASNPSGGGLGRGFGGISESTQFKALVLGASLAVSAAAGAEPRPEQVRPSNQGSPAVATIAASYNEQQIQKIVIGAMARYVDKKFEDADLATKAKAYEALMVAVNNPDSKFAKGMAIYVAGLLEKKDTEQLAALYKYGQSVQSTQQGKFR